MYKEDLALNNDMPLNQTKSNQAIIPDQKRHGSWGNKRVTPHFPDLLLFDL